jgi:hypothetical protein
MKNNKKFLVPLSFLMPGLAFADNLGETKNILTDALRIVNNILIPIAFTLALLFFFWGVAKYIRSAGAEKDEGRMIMVWGVVALFVMASVWGLVKFIRDEFNIKDNANIPIPTIDSRTHL